MFRPLDQLWASSNVMGLFSPLSHPDMAGTWRKRGLDRVVAAGVNVVWGAGVKRCVFNVMPTQVPGYVRWSRQLKRGKLTGRSDMTLGGRRQQLFVLNQGTSFLFRTDDRGPR